MTDALIVLGLVDPRNFLGGRVVLEGESAVAALGLLGRAVGLDPDETARGIYRLATEQMTLAVRTVVSAGRPAAFRVSVRRRLRRPLEGR